VVLSFTGAAAAAEVLIVRGTVIDVLLGLVAVVWCVSMVEVMRRRVLLLATAYSEWFGVRITWRDLPKTTPFDTWLENRQLQTPDVHHTLSAVSTGPQRTESTSRGSSWSPRSTLAYCARMLPIERADLPPILMGIALGVLTWTAAHSWIIGLMFGIAGVITFTRRRRRIRAARS
jgi:hypothetical protein